MSMSNDQLHSNYAYPDFNLRHITTYQSGVIQSNAQRILKLHTDSLLHEFGLTTTHWFIVGTVYDAMPNGITVTKLAKKLGTGVPFLTNTVNLLESKQILLRVQSEDDIRSKKVTVHPDFVSECPRIESALRNKMRNSLYKHIAPEDLTTYIKVLYQIVGIDEESTLS